jgi:RES domain
LFEGVIKNRHPSRFTQLSDAGCQSAVLPSEGQRDVVHTLILGPNKALALATGGIEFRLSPRSRSTQLRNVRWPASRRCHTFPLNLWESGCPPASAPQQAPPQDCTDATRHPRQPQHGRQRRALDGVDVWYGASGPASALAEAFQIDRSIDRFHGDHYLTGLRFTREVRLLDLAADSAGAWPTRAGGTFALSPGPYSITQLWARRIIEAFPDLYGLRYNSRVPAFD